MIIQQYDYSLDDSRYLLCEFDKLVDLWRSEMVALHRRLEERTCMSNVWFISVHSLNTINVFFNCTSYEAYIDILAQYDSILQQNAIEPHQVRFNDQAMVTITHIMSPVVRFIFDVPYRSWTKHHEND